MFFAKDNVGCSFHLRSWAYELGIHLLVIFASNRYYVYSTSAVELCGNQMSNIWYHSIQMCDMPNEIQDRGPANQVAM